MLCTRRLFGFPLLVAFLTLILVLLAACGGGDTPATQVLTSVPATPVPPVTEPPASATDVPAPTAPLAATGSPRSGATTPESRTASTTVPPAVAATVAPAVAPTEMLATNAVRVLRRSCVEDFRQMLLDYDGDAFNAEIVRGLSDEFVELRPDCLAEGWDPEFPDKPEVCLVAKDLDSPLSYTHDRRSVRRFLHPTMRDSSGRFNDGVVLCHL